MDLDSRLVTERRAAGECWTCVMWSMKASSSAVVIFEKSASSSWWIGASANKSAELVFDLSKSIWVCGYGEVEGTEFDEEVVEEVGEDDVLNSLLGDELLEVSPVVFGDVTADAFECWWASGLFIWVLH